MFLTLSIPWQFIDADHGFPHTRLVPPGRYEVERITNPFGYTAEPWIVLKDTKIGGSESFWRWMAEKQWGDFQLHLDTALEPFPSR